MCVCKDIQNLCNGCVSAKTFNIQNLCNGCVSAKTFNIQDLCNGSVVCKGIQHSKLVKWVRPQRHSAFKTCAMGWDWKDVQHSKLLDQMYLPVLISCHSVFVGSILTFRALFMPSSGPLQESKSISFILAQREIKRLSLSHMHTQSQWNGPLISVSIYLIHWSVHELLLTKECAAFPGFIPKVIRCSKAFGKNPVRQLLKNKGRRLREQEGSHVRGNFDKIDKKVGTRQANGAQSAAAVVAPAAFVALPEAYEVLVWREGGGSQWTRPSHRIATLSWATRHTRAGCCRCRCNSLCTRSSKPSPCSRRHSGWNSLAWSPTRPSPSHPPVPATPSQLAPLESIFQTSTS